MKSFNQWLIEREVGPGSGGVPPKENPADEDLTKSVKRAYAPGSEELPPTPQRKEILKSKKKMKGKK